MRLHHLRIFVFVSLAGLLAACGGPSRPPQVAVPGYERLELAVGHHDFTPLRGRRILLDAGHGGRFRGAIGPNGLSEAEVNLGVALYLRGLLEWAGAEVFMTRTADNDLLTPADSSLAADLAARVALADSLQPDVFVSIHHNATASGDPAVNETQTYYPTGREGADLDLARAIHEHLVRALAISPARIMGGNFHVLRNAPVPAVLGEPAMISNPVIEGRLTLAASHELEAKAYFLGLLEYFAGGTPRWATGLADTTGARLLTWTFDPGRAGAPGLDPATVEVWADGEPAAWWLAADGATVSLLVTDPVPRAVALQARNLAGRATPRRHHVLLAPPRPGRLLSGLIHADAGPSLLVYESEGEDLAQRGPLRLGGPELPESAWLALPRPPARRGWLLVEPGPYAFIREGEEAHPVGGLAGGRIDGARWQPLAFAPAAGWRLRSPLPACAPELLDPHAPVVPAPVAGPLWLEADGFLPLFVETAGDTLDWEPLLPALQGRTVVLDPRGGGSDEQGRGPLGTRGADLNLQVARRLASLLRGAGCRVELTRTAETWVPDPVKVLRANDAGADLYVAIARGDTTGRVVVRHHPQSAVGARLAANVARVDGLPPVQVEPGWDYVLRHTACPALVVALESLADAPLAVEDRLTSPAWQDAVARALLLAVAATWQGEATLAAAVDPVALLADLAGSRALPPGRVDWARWDGNFTWLPDFVSSLPANGPRHTLELHAGPSWQLWALSRPGGWQARLLLENR